MSAVTIGNFDGVHLGHQEVLRILKSEAARLQVPSIALTFRPHPQHALRPERAPPLLLTYDEKVARLRAAGLEQVVEQPFGRELSSVGPEEYFRSHLLSRYGARVIVVGHDFAFGKDRAGSQDVLTRLCREQNVSLHIVPPFEMDGLPVSSTRIRRHLLNTELPEANRLLGYPFSYTGPVVSGDRRGRTLGFPTANVIPPSSAGDPTLGPKLQLPVGVYVTETVVSDGSFGQTVHRSVTNLGFRPTFSGRGPAQELLETHLLDYPTAPEGDLYGRMIEVRFLCKIRSEIRFPSREALHAQIQNDVAFARDWKPSTF